jgi:hypothetical protein
MASPASAAEAARRAHRNAAEPGQCAVARRARRAALWWHTRHNHGHARPPCQVMSCPPSATGMSSRTHLARRPPYCGPLRPGGAAVESRRAPGPHALAANVTRATHQAIAVTSASWVATAARIAAGTRWVSTAALASLSAVSLPRRSWAESGTPLLSCRCPTSAATVWAGIQARSAGAAPPVAAKIATQARAEGRPPCAERAGPATRPSTADLQSTRRTAPRPPHETACKIAHTSAPKIVRSHGGGTPCAEARMTPNASKATNAQPQRRSNGVGPSRHEPSV